MPLRGLEQLERHDEARRAGPRALGHALRNRGGLGLRLDPEKSQEASSKVRGRRERRLPEGIAGYGEFFARAV